MSDVSVFTVIAVSDEKVALSLFRSTNARVGCASVKARLKGLAQWMI